MSTIAYEPLADDAIRLVDFEDGSLLTTPLQSSPSFDALSYTWGSDAQPRLRSVVGNHDFDLLPNLHGFFEECKARGYRGKLWADAVCIDQDNTEEKGHQIPLMRDIYSRARQVIVWLGPASAVVEAALSVLPDLALLIREQNLGDWSHLPADWREHVTSYREHWSGFHDILSHAWFNRLWTLQETLLAQALVCWCGSVTVRWQDFVSLAGFITSAQISRHPPTVLWDPDLQSSRNMLMLRMTEIDRNELQSSDERSLDLSDLLITSCERVVSDPSDKVYGLLGLLSQQVRSMLRTWVDPARPVRDTYVEFAKKVIQEDPSMFLLTTAQAGRRPFWRLHMTKLCRTYHPGVLTSVLLSTILGLASQIGSMQVIGETLEATLIFSNSPSGYQACQTTYKCRVLSLMRSAG